MTGSACISGHNVWRNSPRNGSDKSMRCIHSRWEHTSDWMNSEWASDLLVENECLWYVTTTRRRVRLSTWSIQHHAMDLIDWLINILTLVSSFMQSSHWVMYCLWLRHQIDPQQPFWILFRIPPHRSKAVRLRMLATTEAICIRRLNPDLCVHIPFVQ